MLGPDAQDPLRDGDVVPGGRAGQPGVLGLAVGGRVLAGDHLGVDVRLAAVHVADLLARRRVDAQVVVEGPVAVADHGLGDHDPRVVVAEDAGVLLVAGRVGGDLAQLQVVARVGRLLQHDAVRRGQALGDRLQRRGGLAVVEADAGHDAHALRLDEDLALVVLRRADRLAEVVVGAQEPLAVPAVRARRPFPSSRRRRPGSARPRGVAARARSAMAASSFGRQHEQPGDEDRLGHLAVLVVGGLERLAGRVGEAVQVQAVVPVGAADQRQAVRPEPVERVADAALQVLVERRLAAGLVVVGHRLVEDRQSPVSLR